MLKYSSGWWEFKWSLFKALKKNCRNVIQYLAKNKEARTRKSDHERAGPSEGYGDDVDINDDDGDDDDDYDYDDDDDDGEDSMLRFAWLI